MRIEQIYTKCLAQGAYYIESDGEAAVIDPLRKVSEYIELAEKSNSKIKYVFETHFHADFVSGHLTLSKKTGASIVYGPNANPDFEAIIAKDNDEFKIGKIKLTDNTKRGCSTNKEYIQKTKNQKHCTKLGSKKHQISCLNTTSSFGKIIEDKKGGYKE